MPIVGYKKQFKNIPFLKDDMFTINFQLKHKKNGSLTFDKNKPFDSGDYHLLIDKVFEEFTEKKYKNYDNGIMLLSICKYLVDCIPDIYCITHEDKNSVDIYYTNEIIESYNNYVDYIKENK